MIYLGEWGGRSVYQPEHDPETWETMRFLPPPVYKCAACKVNWFRINPYGGLCYACWLEQFEGEEEMAYA